ncbi:MAG: hypothetical protein ABIQ02_10250 [Saprospiraceae bacterium]
MKRKEFLKIGAIAASLGPLDSIFSTSKSRLGLVDFLANNQQDIANLSATLQQDLTALMQWLATNGWSAYLKNAIGLNLSLTGDALKAELLKDLDKNMLKKLTDDPTSGFDDFSGLNAVKPGFPAFSLLYHSLASPRVRPAGILAYPDLAHLDTLENYIYALAGWDDLKRMYEVKSNDDLVLAVFAYEYRPAFKTPHHEHADMVFSRTGVGRIGQNEMSYDKINRCFTNKPKDGEPVEKIAVVPARYGLFIARKVKSGDIDLMKTGFYKPGDKFNDKEDAQRTFLQPIRKVFHHDILFNEARLTFQETHKSEKLAKLVENTDLTFYKNIKPTLRDSSQLIIQDSAMTNVNSSFLVISQPSPLVRLAKEGNKPMYFLVPPSVKSPDGGDYYVNRYFTSFNTQDVEDVELLERALAGGYQKIPNKYNEPRTQPLFLNITHQIDSTNTIGYRQVQKDDAFEKRVYDGLFMAPLFEDSICEGKVIAHIAGDMADGFKGISRDVLPAYSIVTAPDFFPQVDNFDLLSFDVAPGSLENDANFYEGGVASLATCRIIPNPNFIKANGLSDNQTYTAVLSYKPKRRMNPPLKFTDPKFPKGYFVSSFLPDVASSVFAPGWDITYSADKPGSLDVYLSTEGLGSPFVEDMKLCSASNGMWPASSPDSARTYQGALDPDYRNPTAIPLLDDELGFHKNSPAGLSMRKESFGWDGVQGPFLENLNRKWKINFADIGRADVVQNALDGNMDMSKLREITSGELISRMTCLKKCIAHLPKLNFKTKENDPHIVAYTRWWLISAEAVHFGKENAQGWGIPKNLVGTNASWATDKSNSKVSGKGYLYVIVDVKGKKATWDGFGRRRVPCTKIYVCQVADNPSGSPHLAIATVKSGKANWEIIS